MLRKNFLYRLLFRDMYDILAALYNYGLLFFFHMYALRMSDVNKEATYLLSYLRALTDAETRYAQIEKELLAIVFACIEFQRYIYGRSIIQSDHKPLESVFQKPIASTMPPLQRMLLRLLEYNISVQYTPGKQMHIADTLSRSYLREEPPSRVER